ncbi:MAG: T9SS type A sorting domain-containing protein [Acidaminococcaceae bacterium]
MCCFFAAFNTNINAQEITLPSGSNFYDYIEAARTSEFYDDADTIEGGFKSKIDRLELSWGNRLYPHGDFMIANRAIIDYAENFQYIPSDVDPNWICVGPSNTPSNNPSRGVGQIHRIAFDPNYGITNQTVYAASGFGGLWRSENGGDNWVNVNTDLYLPMTTVADVVVSPEDGNTIFIGTGWPDGGVAFKYSSNWSSINPVYTIGVYRSTDYGTSWYPVNDGLLEDFYITGGVIRKMEIDKSNPNIIFLATSNGVYRTTNALADTPEWNNVFEGSSDEDGDFRVIKYKPGSSDVLYAASNNIFKSTDGGSSWNSMTGAETGLDFNELLPFEPYRINLAVTPANSSRVYAYIFGFSNGNEKVYLYYFDGNEWVYIWSGIGSFNLDWMGFAVSPINADEYYFYGRQGFYTGGIMGSKSLTNAPVIKGKYISDGTYADGHVLEFEPNITDNPLLFYGHHGGISVGNTSPPDEPIWEKKNNGLANLLLWSFDDSEFHKDIIVTAKQDHYCDIYKEGEWLAVSNFISDSYSAKTAKSNDIYFFGSSSGTSLARICISDLTIKSESDIIPIDVASGTLNAHITKTFQLKSPPNTNHDFFTFSELYRRKLSEPINNDPDFLWEIDSDIGKLQPPAWTRQLTEYDFCYLQPDYQYLTNGNNVYSDNPSGYWFEPFIAKTSIGGLTNGQYYTDEDAYVKMTYPGTDEMLPLISGIAVHPEQPDKVWVSLIGYDNIDMRVALSTDGGDTWENADPNNSLPNLPVNSIVYQYGSNDVLYVGTDVGIFYKDASMTNWERYGDFPHVRVMELKINYCQSKLRAATFGRSIWEADLMPFDNTLFFEINAGEDIVWENDKALHTSLKIKTGGKLTIKGFLSMPANAVVVVEEGAILEVDNGVIANKCGQPWQGIQIQGNSSTHQWPDANGNYQQGKLVLNNATIENAIVAVDLWKDGDYSKTGGIVHATNSNFINNVRAVHALQYRNFHPVNYDEMAYNASFTNCTFEINADYPGHETFFKHVDLSQVNGLRFNGCDFSLSPDAQNVSDYNQAIASYSAGFRVDAPCNNNVQPCSSYDHSTFNDFRVGIYAAAMNSPYTYYINRAKFNGNTIGVLSNNVNNAIILNSEFHEAKNQYNWEFCTYGIFMQAANSFTIEDNQFFKQQGAPLSNYIGIGVFDCNAIADVYRNEFTGLTAGNYAYGRNWFDELYHGVEYLCNTNTSNWADFYITGNSDLPTNGIQSKQGAISLPARNTFSSSGATWHFYNETKNLVDYYFCQDCSGHYPEYVENVNRESVSTSGTCPPHYGSDTPERSVVMDATELLEAETVFAQSNYDYQGVKTLYNNLKDGGSTEEAIFDVSTAQPSQMWEIRSKLLGDSPYLSTEVLKLAADRTDMFTEAAIFDILAANPDELKKEELMKYLEEKENPLPDYMLNILKQVAEGTSYRTVLELQMSRHSHDRAQAANDIIRSILNADELDMDQLQLWLTNFGGLEAEKQLIATYAHQGDYNLALALAETLPVAYKLQDEQLLDHNQYMSLLQLQQNLKNSGRTLNQLNTAEQQQLTEIAESETASSSAMAKSVLELFYGTGFERCLPIAGEASYKSSAAADLNRLAEHYGMSLSAKPNPAGDWAAFDYTLPEGTETALLEITDAAGKTIATYTLQGRMGQQLTDTRQWPAGQYVYTLKAAGFTQSGKLVVK